MEENKKHPSQIIHGFLMADDRKQKEDVPILTHPPRFWSNVDQK